MLNLPALHSYLTQLLSPTDMIHTALLLTPEGAVVSFACSSMPGSSGCGSNPMRTLALNSTNGHVTPPKASSANGHMTPPQICTSSVHNTQGSTTPPYVLPGTTSSKSSGSPQPTSSQPCKDN